MKGVGTNEEALIEILASRTNKQLQAINNLYPKCNFFSLYWISSLLKGILFLVSNRPLEEDIKSDTSGHFKKLLIALVQGQRPESNRINEDTVQNDAKQLFEAGSNKWGTDESKFIQILANRRFYNFNSELSWFFAYSIFLAMYN